MHGQFTRKWLFAIYFLSYKNGSRLNRYNFGTVNAIEFLFSPLHTTPVLYGKIDFGVLDRLSASVATSDTPLVQTPHIFWQEISIHITLHSYAEGLSICPVR